MSNLNLMKAGKLTGVVSVVFFWLCLGWVLILTPELREFHATLLRVAYPGMGMDLVGLIIGTIEAFVYGWILGTLLAWILKKSS